jgi:RNA polymerase sigma-70 factor, ECF subfamily
LASEKELNDFLKSVEKRAFKRSVYHVRDEDAALDIVQDSMMKLAENYADKPMAEIPLDWFRREKTRGNVLVNMSQFEKFDEDGDFDLLETLESVNASDMNESAMEFFQRKESVQIIEKEIQALPARQREAFLLRYWEELDVAETAAAMGCSEGSVKTHCSRAVAALSKSLGAKGFK